jgi:hypothetical protein
MAYFKLTIKKLFFKSPEPNNHPWGTIWANSSIPLNRYLTDSTIRYSYMKLKLCRKREWQESKGHIGSTFLQCGRGSTLPRSEEDTVALASSVSMSSINRRVCPYRKAPGRLLCIWALYLTSESPDIPEAPGTSSFSLINPFFYDLTDEWIFVNSK